MIAREEAVPEAGGTVTAGSRRLAGGSLARVAAAYLTLTKPKITLLLTACGVAAAFLAAGGSLPWGRLGAFTLFGYLASGGAAALNHLFDRDIDAVMRRTRHRPIPSGRVSPAAAAAFAATLLAVALTGGALVLGPVVAAFMAAGAAIYGGLYTLVLKRTTARNIVIGGLAGSCGALAGWAVVDPGLAPGAWILAALVFLWTPSHFWGLAIARDEDYRAVDVPMLPQVRGTAVTARAMAIYAVLTWAVSLALVPFAPVGLVYGALAFVLGGLYTGLCLAFVRTPSHAMGMRVFKASGAYLGLLIVAMGPGLLVG